MKALVYRGLRTVRYQDVPEPGIGEPHDAVVEVELAGLCGSDLHVYHGREVPDDGTVMGHEFVGRVVEVGAEVRKLARGDRVAGPFSTCCGRCYYCERGLSARCERGQLFGWVERGTGLQGAQAQRVRVPMADATLCPIPDELGAEPALLLCDVLPTGWHCAKCAGAGPGGTHVVLGCGPVGLMAILAAGEMGAERILAIDTVPERLTFATRLGATPVDARNRDPSGAVREATEGRGADTIMEAVGSPEAGRLAFDLVRPGGTISVVGVHHEASFPFSPVQAYDKNLTWRIGRCPARSLMDGLIPLAQRRWDDLAALITHRLPLEQGAAAYEMFDARRDGCIKVVLAP